MNYLYTGTFIALVALVSLGTCAQIGSKTESARKAVGVQFPHVEVTEIKYDFWNMSCGKEDEFKFKWRGVDKQHGNALIEGVVCSGWFKGNTVRTK